jgi:hypothetical protein
MKARPYVGITGLTTVDEVNRVLQEFSQAGYDLNSQHLPMLGFLVSRKTLLLMKTENRRYPALSELPSLLRAAKGKVFATIHYNSREMSTLWLQLGSLFGSLQGLCKTVQLNIVWPEISQLKSLRRASDYQIILQLSEKVMENLTPVQIAQRVKEYDSLVDYVLIDPSGGSARPFNLENSLKVYEQLVHKIPNVTIGFAGGFTGKNVVSRVNELVRRIGAHDFCIDAEGGLRDKLTDNYGDDLLNMEKVKEYIQNTSQVLP